MIVTVDTLGTTDINLVAAVASLFPTLISRKSEADAQARLPVCTIADLEKALVSKMYCGLQYPQRTFTDVIVELGRGDGSAAWAVALLLASTWMAASSSQFFSTAGLQSRLYLSLSSLLSLLHHLE